MTRDKRPDELAREAAAQPTDPMGTMRSGVGTVKWWRNDKGHGVIACADVSPWDIWCHFSAIQGSGFRALSADQSVEVDYYRTDQESFKYVARSVRSTPESEKA